MKQGIIIAGFTALGKTTLAQKYDNITLVQMSPGRGHCFDLNHTVTMIGVI